MEKSNLVKKEYISHYESPLGDIIMACDEKSLTGLWFDGQKYDRATLCDNHEEKETPVFNEVKRWLDIYFNGEKPEFTPPVKIKSEGLEKEVAEILMRIPYGKTATYKEIAACVAKKRGVLKMSAQAVGQAVAHNAIALIVPCHRVVGSDGSLTGYAGGVDKKVELLTLEKVTIKDNKVKND